MTAEIIQFPTPRPWSKYTYDATSRANAERIFEALLGISEAAGPAVGDGPETTPVESAERMTVEALEMVRENTRRMRGEPPPDAS